MVEIYLSLVILQLRPMRQYEPIWNKLKSMPRNEATNIGVSITAPRVMHRRIIKAVKKEKWMDIGYKIQVEPNVTILTHSRNGSILTFYISFYLNLPVNMEHI